MAWMRAFKLKAKKKDESGIALFLVIASMSILAIIATEFTYIAQISQSIAFDGIDQVKAHYLAKTGYKLSLLRLKAYQNIKKTLESSGAGKQVPKAIVERIWNFPFFYPIPKDLPGMTLVQKAEIEKFEKNTALEGSFTANIESDSHRLNLNNILPGFQAPAPSPSPSASAQPSPAPSYNANEARQGLYDYFSSLLKNKFEADADFASDYRDFDLNEFMDALLGWSDRSYQRKHVGSHEEITSKQAPFYSVTELHMLPEMTDELYDLFGSGLTTTRTAGINVNFVGKETLRALFPEMTQDEVTEFFKYRDSQTEDHFFKTIENFYQYLLKYVPSFRGSQSKLDEIKNKLSQRGIELVTDESSFKITVRAQVNQAVRILEAWVSLQDTKPTQQRYQPDVNANPIPNSGPSRLDPGLQVTFMRFL